MDKPASSAMASMICPNPKCRRFITTPGEQRGQTTTCRFCKVRFTVPETQQAVARLDVQG